MSTSYKKMKPSGVVITLTNGQVIDGSINIGFEERVTDFLALPDKPWVPVFDVKDAEGVIIVNKNQVVSVQPKE